MSQVIVASPAEIRRYARGALEKAGVTDVTPVPLHVVEQAIGLFPHEVYTPRAETFLRASGRS